MPDTASSLHSPAVDAAPHLLLAMLAMRGTTRPLVSRNADSGNQPHVP